MTGRCALPGGTRSDEAMAVVEQINARKGVDYSVRGSQYARDWLGPLEFFRVCQKQIHSQRTKSEITGYLAAVGLVNPRCRQRIDTLSTERRGSISTSAQQTDDRQVITLTFCFFFRRDNSQSIILTDITRQGLDPYAVDSLLPVSRQVAHRSQRSIHTPDAFQQGSLQVPPSVAVGPHHIARPRPKCQNAQRTHHVRVGMWRTHKTLPYAYFEWNCLDGKEGSRSKTAP